MEAIRSLWRELTTLGFLESLVTLLGGISLIGLAATSTRPAWAPEWLGWVLVALGGAVALLGAIGGSIWLADRATTPRPDRSGLQTLAAEAVARLEDNADLGPGVADADARSEGMRLWAERWESKVEQALGDPQAIAVFGRPVDTAQMDYRRSPVHRLRVKLLRLSEVVPGLPPHGADVDLDRGDNQLSRPHFLVRVPAALQAEIDERTRVGLELLRRGANPAAFEVFRFLLERMLGEQTDGHRLHKGLPLHNMGLARMRSGLIRDGIRWTLMAFIEDALSRAEEASDISVELYRPAAENLRLYGLSHAELVSLAQRIRRQVDHGELIQDPAVIVLEEDLQRTVERVARTLEGGQVAAVEPARFPPVRFRVSIPLGAEFSFTLAPGEATTLVTASLAILASIGAAGLLWALGLLEEHWQLAVGVSSGGVALAAAIGLIVRVAGRTALGRVVLATVRMMAAHILGPLLVAIVGGVLVAYLTGG